MAPPKTMSGRQLLVQIGDGETPEVFAHDCLINTERGIAFAAETNRERIPDCENPDAPGWSEVTISGQSATITGAGRLHTTSVKKWFAWFTSGEEKNIRVLLNGVSAANGGGHWAGAYKLSAFDVTGPETGRAAVSVTLESHGVVTWVDAT